MKNFLEVAVLWAGLVLGFVFVVAIIGGLMLLPSYLAMLAWNYVAHESFGAPELTFWKTFVGLWLFGVLASHVRKVFSVNGKSE